MSFKKIAIPKELKANTLFRGLQKMYEGKIDKTDYLCFYSKIGILIHVRIHRKDSKPICNWIHLQEIKDLLIGSNKIAIQVFPKSSDLINNGNTYHLFSYPGLEAPNLTELYDYAAE